MAWIEVTNDYSQYDQKVRTIMYCFLWQLPPEKHYNHFVIMNDSEYWFKNCPDDKTEYYKKAQEYLRKDKIRKLKNGLQ